MESKPNNQIILVAVVIPALIIGGFLIAFSPDFNGVTDKFRSNETQHNLYIEPLANLCQIGLLKDVALTNNGLWLKNSLRYSRGIQFFV